MPTTHDPWAPHTDHENVSAVESSGDLDGGDDIPEHADDVVEFIGDNPANARKALAHELARPESRQRLTVLRAAQDVLGDDGA